jgi:uncharacterized protein (DUF427 family)
VTLVAETKERAVKVPGPDHPIAVTPTNGRVVVKIAGREIADSRNALTLKVATYAEVLYLPRADVDMTLLRRTEHASYCPYKGDAAYFTVSVDGAEAKNAVWTYEAPYEAVAEIRGSVAFYPDRVDSIERTP